jgi:hypothetical protein
VLAPSTPDFGLLLIDLASLSDEQLTDVAIVELTLLLLRHGRDADLFVRLPGWVPLFREVAVRNGLQFRNLVLEDVVEMFAEGAEEVVQP